MIQSQTLSKCPKVQLCRMGFGSASLYVVTLLIASILTVSATYSYTGSKAYYLLFTFSYFCLLLSALKKMNSYSYLFLSVFLWLGFWLKFTFHTVFNYSYEEPIGSFMASPTALDQVLLIAVVGCWGVISAYYLARRLGLKQTVFVDSLTKTKVPQFYIKHRILISLSLITTVIVSSILNLKYGVFQIGLPTRTLLIWPLNALAYWCLAIGFALMITTVLWWELQYKQQANPLFVCSLSEPFFCTVSIFSRALFIFHFVPVFLAFVFNRKNLGLCVKNTRLFAVLCLSGVLFLVAMQTVSLYRNYHYSGVSFEKQSKTGLIHMIEHLAIDRWLGVEGVMAVSSYPHKSMDLLEQGLVERPIADKVGMYQYIAQSHYTQMDSKKFIFGTLPGSIAFFYYSGLYSVVFLGMFALTVLMLFSEVLVAWLTHNVFLVALFAADIANAVAQFGVTPLMMIKHFLLIFVYCAGMYVVCSRLMPSPRPSPINGRC